MLSPRKINRGSPIKQNLSPTRKNLQCKKQQKVVSAQILISAIHQLQCIIVKLGGQVPQHLNYGFNNKIQLVKPQNVDQSILQAEIRGLKIKISNFEFQLKKRQEDQAQYKILSKLDRDKQVKRLKNQVIKLQSQLKQDNHKWQLKFEEMKQLYRRKAQTQISEMRLKFQNLQSINKQQNQLIMRQTILRYQKKVQEIQIQKNSKIQQLYIELQKKIQQKRKTHQQQKEQIRLKHVQQIKKHQKIQDQIMTAHQSEKKVEKKKQQQQKITANKTKQKLYTDIYLIRKQKQQLHKKLIQQKTQILKLQKEIRQKQYEIQRIQKTHKQQTNSTKLQHIYQLEKLKKENKNKIQQIYRLHDKKLHEYEKRLEKIQQIRDNKQVVFQEIQRDIQRKFQDRPSRIQDTSNIQKLTHQIILKNQQLLSTKNELKQMKLERENNQKNYNRIFASQGPQQRQRSRQRLTQRPSTATCSREKSIQRQHYRQGHTVDINFLLKVCNKNF